MTSKLDKSLILQSFEHGVLRGGVHLFETIDSTNNWVLAEIGNGRDQPFVCLADHQTKGRGRRGRHWLSPPGANIYLTLAWRFELPPHELGLLALAQGVAVLNALKRIGIADAWLKWPNDVLVAKDKIAGVLIETRGVSAAACNAAIGIGLNYHMPETIVADSSLDWTDIVGVLEEPVPERNLVAAMLLHEMVDMCRRYQQKAMAIYSELESDLVGLNGRQVAVRRENLDETTGIVLGIAQTGELRLLVEGKELRFNSADVSLTAAKNASAPGAEHADH